MYDIHERLKAIQDAQDEMRQRIENIEMQAGVPRRAWRHADKRFADLTLDELQDQPDDAA